MADTTKPITPLPAYVITLVHGTFAKEAEWTKEGSPLRQTLEKTLPGSVLFTPFKWSGDNSVISRHVASEQLREALVRQLAIFPGARHYVVSHSHGGNIIMYAMRDSELERSISGVVCLSTPFLHVKERDLGGPYAKTIVRSLLMACIMVGLFLFLGSMITTELLYSSPYLYLMLALCILVLTGPLADFLLVPLERMARHWLKLMELPQNMSEKLLIIRTAGDEATFGLGVSSLASWAGAKMIQGIAWSQNKLAQAMPLAWLVDILISLPALFLIIPMALASVAFGPRLGLCSVLLEINAEVVPPGSWPVHYLYPKAQGADNSLSLSQFSHCRAYQDDQALDLIQRWIRSHQSE